jgi:hypothetical protein
MDSPNLIAVLYKTSHLSESQSCFKSINIWVTVALYSHFSQVSDVRNSSPTLNLQIYRAGEHDFIPRNIKNPYEVYH